MSNAPTDTIVAIATAPGAGGVGIVRLSGPRAKAIAACIAGMPPVGEPPHGPAPARRRAPGDGVTGDDATGDDARCRPAVEPRHILRRTGCRSGKRGARPSCRARNASVMCAPENMPVCQVAM